MRHSNKLTVLIIINIFIFTSVYAQQGWFQQISGTQNDLYSIKFFNSSTGIALGMSRTVLRTVNGGNTWQQISLPVFPYGYAGYFFALKNTTTGWISGSAWNGLYWTAVMKTTDAGMNWTLYHSNFHDEVKQIYFINDVMGWAIAAPPRILRTAGGGGWWESCYIGYNYSFIMKGIIFTDSLNGFVYGFDTTAKMASYLKTTSSGVHWSYIITDKPYSFNSAYFINSQTGYIACDSGRILRTTSTLGNFEVITPGSKKNLSSIQFINTQTGWAVGVDYNLQIRGLVMKTTDGGNNWVSYLSGSGWLYDIDFVNQQTGWACGWFGTILKSTNGGSVYAGQNNTTVPSDFILQQNYPNPFNAQTRIDFTLNRESDIVLSVFDVSGKNVKTSAKGRYSAGNYSIMFDGAGLPSGVYFYSLSDGINNITRKMLITK